MFNPTDFSLTNLFAFTQSVMFLKWIFLLILVGFIIFLFIIFAQIKSMNRVITQQSSAGILLGISIALLVISTLLSLFVLRL